MRLERRHLGTAWRGALLLSLVLLAGAHPAGAQGVHVGITPANLTVSPGAEFDLDLTVTQAGALFNGFDATVTFDPAALTFMPLSPTSLQQGCLMTGACSAACGNTFHRFSTLADSIVITDILLCNQIALTGPGQVYKLHFKASSIEQVTYVRFRWAKFYNAGLYVTPVITADARITIGPPTGVDVPPAHLAGLRLRAEPNPGRGPIALLIEADVAGAQRLEVHDVSGRRVRSMDLGWREPGSWRVTWDGRDESGARVSPGVYLVALGAGDRSARVRLLLLR